MLFSYFQFSVPLVERNKRLKEVNIVYLSCICITIYITWSSVSSFVHSTVFYRIKKHKGYCVHNKDIIDCRTSRFFSGLLYYLPDSCIYICTSQTKWTNVTLFFTIYIYIIWPFVSSLVYSSLMTP